ncbi:glycoside hydrolase family 3 C-terminal domain-containing protein [Streptomyces sp. NPDC005438]|uniref:glycoside hydrolase family 3 protein n=1 Tax=Streptomyces sp. NPDC005438 TaxID=3156880 RepID=UPI0033BCB28D
MNHTTDPYQRPVEDALAALDLDDKTRLLAGQDMWRLPAHPAIGLESLVTSDGPVGVRGTRWSAEDPSLALPSPTALAATWDPRLARLAGRLLAQEARRKGVHLLLAPTVNLHRSPLGGRHFECYSEDPHLTGAIGSGYVLGVQDGGVGTTVKHFVANDAETQRMTVDNLIDPRTLRELYLRPFETIVRRARPWGVMSAYNSVNGHTMSEHHQLQTRVLREEWGFDGVVISDWTAARDTAAALLGGLDLAMPGPRTVYGPALARAVREGRVPEHLVDQAVRRLLRLAARTGALRGTPPAVPADQLPPPVDGPATARQLARRSFVLLRNDRLLPLDPDTTTVALLGAAARDARVLGGGSATVFPDHVTSPLDGLGEALPDGALRYALGTDPNEHLSVAGRGFDLTAVARDQSGAELGRQPLPGGEVRWVGEFPDGVDFDRLHSVEITGTLTPRESGDHDFGTLGVAHFRLEVDGRVLFHGPHLPVSDDPFEGFLGSPAHHGTVRLTAGQPVTVSLRAEILKPEDLPLDAVSFALTHREPRRDPGELIAEAVRAARRARVAVVVVATTDRVESEGFDRDHLRLPGHQDALVEAVAEANPRTVVVVNAGSPVEMPWRDRVAAVLVTWFPGQEGGAALADVLLGHAEPGGRLPTTWPATLEDAPVRQVVPEDGQLPYREGLFIGYRAWDRSETRPAYPFGHGLGYTTWDYLALEAARTPEAPEGATQDGGSGLTATVRVRNSGDRPGREVVQLYLNTPTAGAPSREHPTERAATPARSLVGFAVVEARPGQEVTATVELDPRAAQTWDERAGGWRQVPGRYRLEAGRSVEDVRLHTEVDVPTP